MTPPAASSRKLQWFARRKCHLRDDESNISGTVQKKITKFDSINEDGCTNMPALSWRHKLLLWSAYAAKYNWKCLLNLVQLSPCICDDDDWAKPSRDVRARGPRRMRLTCCFGRNEYLDATDQRWRQLLDLFQCARQPFAMDLMS